MPDQIVTPPPAPVPPKAGDAVPPNPAPPAVPPSSPPATPPATPPAAGDGGAGAPAAAKPGDSTKPTDGQPPVVYDLKLPDGSALDASDVADISAFAKTQNLSKEQAQAILERENITLKAYVDSQQEELATKKAEWVESVKADKEIGGDAFNENVELAKRVIDKFGTDSFKKALTDSGLGNH